MCLQVRGMGARPRKQRERTISSSSVEFIHNDLEWDYQVKRETRHIFSEKVCSCRSLCYTVYLVH